MKLLILLVVIVGIIAVSQLARIYELTSLLRKKREEEISFADNKMNAKMWLVFGVLFFASFIWLMVRYGDYQPPSASAHGEEVDTLMFFNMVIIIIVFFIVNTLLFWFASKYYYRKDRKAKFFPHDNRLELIWTVIPSIVLAVIIIYGLRTWNAMTGEAQADAIQIELYSKQFDWTARYAGADAEFGLASYNLITPTNPLGIVTVERMEESLADLEKSINKLKGELDYEYGHLMTEKHDLEEQLHEGSHDPHHGNDEGEDHGEEHDDHHHGMSEEMKAAINARIAEIDKMLAETDKITRLTDAAYEAKSEKLYRLERQVERIAEIDDYDFNGVQAWEAGKDDRIVKGEFHIPVGREIEFVFRSRDVIHSAYMPHFRAQMNCVPGLPTRFKMTPTITTDSMRLIMDDEEFDYVLLCNKVCGAAHFNMQMKIVVETEEQYKDWLEQQDTFYVEEVKEEEAPAPAAEEAPVPAEEVAEEPTETASLN
ncbi:cytochrome c oxidase subunit II transmembrane domain-containing protein [Sanyastnella coralliicola]|uniref:cytochrome c oxidase subunit II transmembrane domain-containing protein n=1 Tax=Sanyastnella coralliicola TaxID=3069118 RepID=UPI0027BA2B05|nr:cytochrome c oxidase subunit II transmembrane domain-containing protein [Longitalea sp. SCSIO 12813]